MIRDEAKTSASRISLRVRPPRAFQEADYDKAGEYDARCLGLQAHYRSSKGATQQGLTFTGATFGTRRKLHAFLFSGGQAIDLGSLQNPLPSASTAWAVNDQGQIAGYSTFNNSYHAFIYCGGKMHDIQTNATYTYSFGYGINNSGRVVGSQMIDLDTLIDPEAGWVLDYAWKINDAGQITCPLPLRFGTSKNCRALPAK